MRTHIRMIYLFALPLSHDIKEGTAQFYFSQAQVCRFFIRGHLGGLRIVPDIGQLSYAGYFQFDLGHHRNVN